MGIKSLELVRGDGPMTVPASGLVAGASAHRVRIVDGALSCIACQGLAKTTLDDVARAAGCSRATVYRAFPGGKDAVVQAVADTELARLFTEVALHMGEAGNLEDALVEGMSVAARLVSTHQALLFLLEFEPEVILPHLAFAHHDEVLRTAANFAAPFLGRWLGHDEAVRLAEWSARIVFTYIINPADGIDLTDPASTRRIVRTYVLPGVRVLAAQSALPPALTAEHHPANRPVNSPVLTATKGEAS